MKNEKIGFSHRCHGNNKSVLISSRPRCLAANNFLSTQITDFRKINWNFHSCAERKLAIHGFTRPHGWTQLIQALSANRKITPGKKSSAPATDMARVDFVTITQNVNSFHVYSEPVSFPSILKRMLWVTWELWHIAMPSDGSFKVFNKIFRMESFQIDLNLNQILIIHNVNQTLCLRTESINHLDKNPSRWQISTRTLPWELQDIWLLVQGFRRIFTKLPWKKYRKNLFEVIYDLWKTCSVIWPKYATWDTICTNLYNLI